MDTNTDTFTRLVAAAVAEAMKAGDWSEKGLAEATGIPRVTLRRRLAGAAPFNVAELAAIADTLGTTVVALTKDAA